MSSLSIEFTGLSVSNLHVKSLYPPNKYTIIKNILESYVTIELEVVHQVERVMERISEEMRLKLKYEKALQFTRQVEGEIQAEGTVCAETLRTEAT